MRLEKLTIPPNPDHDLAFEELCRKIETTNIDRSDSELIMSISHNIVYNPDTETYHSSAVIFYDYDTDEEKE